MGMLRDETLLRGMPASVRVRIRAMGYENRTIEGIAWCVMRWRFT